jgi:hypothetical protein
MLREAQRVRSAMLVANAWHARSDAASSLVVAIGIVGSLAGWRLLDPIAAAVVGFMVARMGWIFGWDALQDLSDRALDEETTHRIRALLLSTPGVRDVHELRTRKMGDAALVDAHILVEPRITVSEGHYIAETARLRVLQDPHVLDALIHVDPENDDHPAAWGELPPRERLQQALERELASRGIRIVSLDIHYLRHGVELDILLSPDAGADNDGEVVRELDLDVLARRLGVRQIRLLRTVDTTAARVPA